jgi:hypothetical protein
MATNEDIEIAKEARAVEIARESGGVNLAGEQEMSFGADPSMTVTPGGGGGFPTQEQANAMVSDVAGPGHATYGTQQPSGYDPQAFVGPQAQPDFVPVPQAEGPIPGIDIDYADDSFAGPQSMNQYYSEEPPAPRSVQEALDQPYLTINNPTYAYDPRYDAPELAPETLTEAPEVPDVMTTPEDGEAPSGDMNKAAKAAAKFLAMSQVSRSVYDSMAPEEREALEQKFLSKAVGEAAKGAVAPETTQSMAAKSPFAALAQEKVDNAQAKVELIDDKITAMERLNSREKLRAQEETADKFKKIEKSDAAFDDLKKAMTNVEGAKVDRNRWWNNKSTGQKIAAFLSLAISGYQQGKSGRGGMAPALKMMLKAIDDDVSDQVRSYNAGIKGKQTLYAMYRQQGLDHDKAEIATKVQHSRDLDDKIKGIRIKKDSVALQQAQQELKDAQSGLFKRFRPENFAQQMTEDKHKYAKGEAERKRESNVRDENGRYLLARTPGEATAANEIYANAKVAIKQFDKMADLMDTANLADLVNHWSSTSNQIRAHKASMTAAFKSMVSPGDPRLSDQDQKRLDEVNRDMTTLFSMDIGRNISDAAGVTKLGLEALESFKQYTLMRRDQELASKLRGYQPPAGERKRIKSGPRP